MCSAPTVGDRPSRTHLALVGASAGLILAAAVVAFAYARFAPESSPVARGAAHAATHRCGDSLCRGERLGAVNACRSLEAGTSCADVTAYWQAIRLRQGLDHRLLAAPNNRLLAGERLARELNCFQCHGELGQGGFANAGAFKNYVPGYFGNDFRLLTDGGRTEVVREWIETGDASVLSDHPLSGWIARLFLERQAISMPRFSGLETDEIDLLADYVIALNGFGPLDTHGLTRYARATSAHSIDKALDSLASNHAEARSR
jgi:hypothetical protein